MLDSFWKGPVEDGITFSLLCKFLVCPERFFIQTVLGLREPDEFNHSIHYGNLFHLLEEFKGDASVLTPYYEKLVQRYPASEAEILKWVNVVKAQYPAYLHWQKNLVGIKPYKYLFHEQSFRVPYPLPSGRTVTLRGKIDGAFFPSSKLSSVYIQENKSKGYIDEDGITQSVGFNLQTGLYTAVYEKFRDQLMPASYQGPPPMPCRGVLYNVIRRPLSGQKFSIVRKKGTKNHPPESEKSYYSRLAAIIKANASHFFYRWQIALRPSEIQHYQTTMLDPILERLMDWWEWVQSGDRWRTLSHSSTDNTVMVPNLYIPGGGIHYQYPFGVYHGLAGGFRGDYFKYLTTGDDSQLEPIDTLFPELEMD